MAFLTPTPRSLSTLSIRHFAPQTRNPKPPPRAVVAPPHIPPPARIAVIGGGLAGLATAYHLRASVSRYLRKRAAPAPEVHLISPGRAPSGASAAAAGLLHPFTPRVKKLAWRARRGLAAAEHLLAAVGTPARQPGLLRLAFSERQVADFRAAANRYPAEVQYLEPAETAFRFPAAAPRAAAFLPRAWVVDTPEYVRKLREECARLGVVFVDHKVPAVADVLGKCEGRYDTVVVCTGADTLGLADLAHVPITACRGQNLLLRSDAPLPEVPVISGKYVIPDYFGHGVIAGATFEYAEEEQPIDSYLQDGSLTNPPRAVDELREPVEKLVPDLFSNSEVISSWAGLRAMPPRSDSGSIPVACRVQGLADDVSVWLLTGLGSRGLLHHAYLGRVMAHAVVAGNERLIPFEARRFEIALEGGTIHNFEEETAAAAVHAQ